MTAQELADAAMDYAKAKQRNGEAESRQEQKAAGKRRSFGTADAGSEKAARAAVKAAGRERKAALLEDGQTKNRWISEQIEQTRAQIDQAEAGIQRRDGSLRRSRRTWGLDYDGMFEALKSRQTGTPRSWKHWRHGQQPDRARQGRKRRKKAHRAEQTIQKAARTGGGKRQGRRSGG